MRTVSWRRVVVALIILLAVPMFTYSLARRIHREFDNAQGVIKPAQINSESLTPSGGTVTHPGPSEGSSGPLRGPTVPPTYTAPFSGIDEPKYLTELGLRGVVLGEDGALLIGYQVCNSLDEYPVDWVLSAVSVTYPFSYTDIVFTAGTYLCDRHKTKVGHLK